MYAIIKTGGKQYRVNEGDVISVEKLDVASGEKIVFDEILVVSNNGELQIGAPVVSGAKVEGTVVQQGKEKKVVVFKYKPKKDYRKKQGHRQPFTKVKIEKISL
ncbi:MAG TPA: 50S ribosomal protein L21 [Patescibacteria group bacterium]|jgi:large subunit ribosomal protein L21|nr:50S ribosomal protein L21 [Patescibacteria group bacterium]